MVQPTRVRPCSVPGCSKRAQTRRLCKAHGGGVRCRVSSCKKLAQTRGLCVAHGGGRRCSYEGCTKLGQYTGFCLSHGGGRRCKAPNCNKFVQLRGYCKRHARQFLESATSETVAGVTTAAKVVKSKLSLDFLLSPISPDNQTEDTAPLISTPFISLLCATTNGTIGAADDHLHFNCLHHRIANDTKLIL